MQRGVMALLACLVLLGCGGPPDDGLHALVDDYLATWTDFYPSQALAAGLVDAAGQIEDLEQERIDAWLTVNRATRDRLTALPAATGLEERIDRRLLADQVEREFYRWNRLEAHRHDPRTYSDLANHCLTPLLVRSEPAGDARIAAVVARLDGTRRLTDTARRNLVSGGPTATSSAVDDLRATAAFFKDGLTAALDLDDDDATDVRRAAETAAASLDELAEWLEVSLAVASDDARGEQRYGRELALAYGGELTPDRLERLAAAEIETVRGRMADLAARHWRTVHDGEPPAEFDALVRPLLDEMERRHAGNQAAFLHEFLNLIDRSERFLRDRDLVDLPAERRLYTALSPAHFAGAAVGGVYPAGPFDPDAETLFFLPTVPDSAPEATRDGFYRSFNTAFNTMIISHEIYPGHSLQLKAAAAHASPVRPLFAGNDFTEGWATFCEQMTLDAGWDDDRTLTRMAHLRKRLENAVRAYVSVQVHCRGWDRDRLQGFAVDTGLLPPQFADNLWYRAVLSPIQLPSYFLGYRVFDEAWRRERDRLGDAFSAKAFNQTVLASGGVPLDLLDDVLDARLP